MNDIPNNHHRPADELDGKSTFDGGKRTHVWLIAAACIWAVVMLFALPALTVPRFGQPRQPIEFQVITTCITVLVLFGLARSVSGWRHILVAPLWGLLIFMEWVAWLWPNKPW